VNRRRKLVADIGRNPRDVRFDDACGIAEWLGFMGKGVRGSHHAFARPGEATLLNFQSKGGKIPAYQARQLLAMIDRYGDEL